MLDVAILASVGGLIEPFIRLAHGQVLALFQIREPDLRCLAIRSASSKIVMNKTLLTKLTKV